MYSVIIPSKNSLNLCACVDAIRDAGEMCRILVIDDGLEYAPSDCEALKGKKPFCFARNVNIGIEYAAPDDVILLNDDALLKTEHGFSALAEGAEQYSLVSAAIDGVVCNERQHPREGGLRPEDEMVAFVCVYLPRDTIDRVGMLDERYTSYGYEDNDYCNRLKHLKMEMAICDDCIVEHGSLPSTFRSLKDISRLQWGNSVMFERKWRTAVL